ncbi:MAG: PAS domain S-box protein, partial [Deltaproteobacteria bacterium]
PNFANPAQTRKPLLLNNAHSHPLTEAERETLREYEVAHLLVVPALHHGETVGLLVLSRSDEGKRFTPPEVETALALAAQMGSAIHNASLYRKALERETEWVHTFNSITDMLFILDRDFSLLSCNEVFLQKYGWRREDVLGRKCYDLFECSKYPSNRCEHIRCIEEKSPIETFYEDFNLSGKFRVKVSPIFDERGEVVKTVHLVQDVTKEKEYEEKLNESLRKTKEMSEYLTALLDSSPDCIISADQKGNIVFINRGAEELLGYGEDELVGKHVSEVYPSLEEARRVGRAMKENGGKVRNFHSRLRKKDGELIDVLISVATLHDAEGNKRGTVGISKDISQLKKMEEHLRQAEKLTALGKLASGIAHDFNNLLTAIAMRVELLKMKISDEDAIKELSIIENAALRGTSTVEKLKSFYRKEPGKMSPVNLNDVIREAAEITSPRWKNIAESRGIRFDLELKLDNNLKKIEGNYGELKDAFINLFINAIDAMPEGGTIRVVTSNVFDSVRVVFSDTGVGMDDEVKVRAFEPFFSTKGEKGTGLGLSTVYGIVTRHGGSLEMETEKGKGTSFTLTFPIMRKSDSEEAGREESPKPPPSLSGVTVYLFEDEEDIRASLETLMRERGARVFSFGDPEKGIQEVTSLMGKDGEKGKRVVITDLGMPGLNGFEVTRRIKEKNGSVPVVMLTGWGTFVEPSHAKTQGVDRVVSKPVKMDDLLAAVGDLLGLSG